MLAGLRSRWTRPRVCGVVQRLGDRRHQLGRFPERRPSLAQPLRQIAARHVPGDDVAEPVVRSAHVVHGDDVRVVEPGDGACFGQVRLDVGRAGDALGVGDLDRHRTVEVVVVRQVDPPESPLAQRPDHPVSADGTRVARRGRVRPDRGRARRQPGPPGPSRPPDRSTRRPIPIRHHRRQHGPAVTLSGSCQLIRPPGAPHRGR